MPNELDETDVSTINHEGRDVHVIEKKVTVTLDGADKGVNIAVWFIFIIGGFVYAMKKAKALSYFQQLQQKIQHAASTIDNYLLQRVNILQNTAKLVEKAIDLDKSTFTEIARLRSGAVASDEARIELAEKLNAAEKSINVAFENYPELKAHQEIADAMQQNNYLQHEITAAREIYNDAVLRWNSEIFERWAKKFVAGKQGYSTRIPFSVSDTVKAQANSVFF